MDMAEKNPTQQPGRVKADLHSVHETLLLPLWCRAEAAERDGAAFSDAQAVGMVRRLDYDFSRFRSKIRRFFVVMLAARAKEQDEIIGGFLREHPGASVVNIGAGLDTTFYRVNNGKVRWYDLDVPDVMNLRRALLRQSPQVCPIARSMFDPGFPEEIVPPEDGILFLASGVLMYFPEEEIRLFLARIATRFPGCEIVFDALTPFGVWVANRMLRRSGISNAEIRWGIPGAADMERWEPGIRIKERFPVCCKISPRGRFGLLSSALIRLNRILRVYTLNHIQAG